MNGNINVRFLPKNENSVLLSFELEYSDNQIGKIKYFDSFSKINQTLPNLQAMFDIVKDVKNFLKHSTLSSSISIYNVNEEKEVFMRSDGYWVDKPTGKAYLDSIVCYQGEGMMSPSLAVGVREPNNLSIDLSKEQLDPVKDKDLINDCIDIEETIRFIFNQCKSQSI